MSLQVTVLVPTIGRVDLLEACLRSVLACSQCRVRSSSWTRARARKCPGSSRTWACADWARARRGISLAMNEGLAAARFDRVLVTHDDCVVAPDWIGVAVDRLGDDRGLIITGRVEPGDGADPRHVPSVKVDRAPHDFTGELSCGALYPNNMAVDRDAVLALGGFDERLPFVEDNDLGYRWLASGRAMRYEPDMVVWHRAWRSSAQLSALYVTYWRAQGVFYAKHLLQGDRTILRFLRRDLHQAARYAAARLLGRVRPWSDDRSGIWRGLPAGLVAGARRFARSRG